MAGTTGSFPVDWVLKLEQNREEGWGPIQENVCCNNAKQTYPVSYGYITFQQVRNCATSLVLKMT